jgi:hypothetical protein
MRWMTSRELSARPYIKDILAELPAVDFEAEARAAAAKNGPTRAAGAYAPPLFSST